MALFLSRKWWKENRREGTATVVNPTIDQKGKAFAKHAWRKDGSMSARDPEIKVRRSWGHWHLKRDLRRVKIGSWLCHVKDSPKSFLATLFSSESLFASEVTASCNQKKTAISRPFTARNKEQWLRTILVSCSEGTWNGRNRPWSFELHIQCLSTRRNTFNGIRFIWRRDMLKTCKKEKEKLCNCKEGGQRRCLDILIRKGTGQLVRTGITCRLRSVEWTSRRRVRPSPCQSSWNGTRAWNAPKEKFSMLFVRLWCQLVESCGVPRCPLLLQTSDYGSSPREHLRGKCRKESKCGNHGRVHRNAPFHRTRWIHERLVHF